MDIKDVKALDGRVILQFKKEQEKTAGGLIIPKDNAKAKMQIANVISVAKDVEDIEPGDEVIYDKYSGSIIQVPVDENAIEVVDYLITRKEDILAVIKKGE